MSSHRSHKWLCAWWIPTGLALFFIGIFWAPNAHIFAVTVPYILLLPGLLAALLAPRRLTLTLNTPTAWAAAAYLVFMVVTSILINRGGSIAFIKPSVYIFFFIITIGLYTDIHSKSLENILFAGAIAAISAGLYALYRDLQSGHIWSQSYRLTGYANLYNALRSGIMFGAFSLFAYWYSSNPSRTRSARAIGLLIAGLCLACVVLTGSRAPLIALASIGIFVTIANKRWYYLIAAITASCLIIGLFWDRLSERGASLRPEIWRYVWMQSLDTPWLGIGLNRQPIAVPTATGIMYGAHNIFLAVLYQGGFIGLTLFLLMVVTVFFNSWALRSTSRLAALAALLQLYAIVALQFEAVSLCTRPTDTWLLLWLPLALYLYARRELNTRSLREMPCTAS